MGIDVKHFYQQLPGWFDYQDIYRAEVERAPMSGATFVELGTWCGRSAAYLMVEIINSGKVINAFTVDHWNGMKHQNPPLPWDYEKVVTLFDSELRAAGVANRPIAFSQGKSADVACCFRDASVDFVFIDAAHQYEAVKKDINAWWSKVKPGGTFAGHDYRVKSWPGVAQAVDEFAKRESVKIEHVGNSWRTRKP